MLTTYQIIKNESKPAHELVSEKELSTYSRWTRNRYVDGSFSPEEDMADCRIAMGNS